MDRMAALEAFVKVSETKSFTEAAARLGQSKSAVSRHITALETELRKPSKLPKAMTQPAKACGRADPPS